MAKMSEPTKDEAVKRVFDDTMAMAESAWLRFTDEQRAGYEHKSWIAGYLAGAFEVMFSVA